MADVSMIRHRLFVADSRNGRVRRVAPDGTVTTVFGTGVGNGSSPPSRYSPAGVAVDGAGRLLIADALSHRIWGLDGVAAPGLLAGRTILEAR
jgi:hypothetical protein